MKIYLQRRHLGIEIILCLLAGDALVQNIAYAQHARRAHSKSSARPSRPTILNTSSHPAGRPRDAFDAFEDFMTPPPSAGSRFNPRRNVVNNGPSRPRYRPWKFGADSPCGSGDGGLRVRRQRRRFRRKAESVRRRVRSPLPSTGNIDSLASSVRLSFLDGFAAVSDTAADLWDYTVTTFRCATATGKITAANVVAFSAQLLSPSVTSAGAKVSRLVLERGQYYRLVTPIILHGGLAHLAVNMYSLANLGPLVDRTFGTNRFFWTYLAGGVMGNVFSTFLSSSNSVGASGAIFGLVGAYYVFLRRNKQFFGQSAEDGIDSMTTTVVVNIGLGLTNPVIDNWAHIGGCVGGALAAYTFGPRLFLVRTAQGTTLVDSPLIQIPRFIQNIPRVISNNYRQIKRQLQFEVYSKDLSRRPNWRRLWWFW